MNAAVQPVADQPDEATWSDAQLAATIADRLAADDLSGARALLWRIQERPTLYACIDQCDALAMDHRARRWTRETRDALR